MTAAQAAGDIASKYFRRDPTVWDKPDGAGPVTEADLAANECLNDTLRRNRPDYGWLSEETDDDLSRLDHETVFIIDPIDGTRAFIDGQQNWSHSLAICTNGATTHAAVYLPIRDRLFTAELGKGAALNGQPLFASNRSDPNGASILSAKPNFKPELWTELPIFNVSFRSSLAYRLALVAQGRFDAMLTLRKTWEWDVAAGDLICTEAGAKVTDRTGAIPKYNNKTPQIDCMVAAAAKLHPEIMSRLA